MQLFDTTQVALERAMSGASMRHQVLAGNIANANTPGYTPQDVDFQGALTSAMSAANEGRTGELERLSFAPKADGNAQMCADGSGFDIDAQAAKLAANGLQYQALVTVSKGRIDIIKSALGTR